MTNEKFRLLLQVRQGLTSPSRRFRGEPSYSGSMVPGVFDTLMIARSAAESYLLARPDVERVIIRGADSGEQIEVIVREKKRP